MLFFQGYRSPRLGGAEKIRANKLPLTLVDAVLDGFSDFLVNFILGGSAFSGAECAKSDEIEDNKAAMVWIIDPRLILIFISALSCSGREKPIVLNNGFEPGRLNGR
jgi:hypothetical protein